MVIVHEMPTSEQIAVNTVYSGEPQYHWHEHYEIIAVADKFTDFYINGSILRLGKGDMVYIPPYVIHSTIKLSEVVCKINVFSFQKALFEHSSDNGALISEASLYEQNAYILRTGETFGYLPGLAELACTKNTERNSGESEIQRGFVILLLGLFRKFGEPASGEGKSSKADDIKYICRFIETDFGKTLTAAETARRLHYSPSYFSRAFKKNTGCSFKKYMDIVKIREAQRLLRTGTYNVTETAYHLGFSSPENFCRTYKRIMGKSPKNDCMSEIR